MGQTTHDDIMAAIAEVNTHLVEINARIEALEKEVSENRKETKDVNKRVTSIEQLISFGKGAWKAVGIMGAVVVFLAGIFFGVMQLLGR